MFQRMVRRVLEGRFDIRQEGGYSKVGKVCPEARNLFTSSYEYVPSKGTGVSLLGKVGTGVLKVMGGLISFSGWFPEAKVDVSAERYLLAKGAYLQPLKKAIN